MTLILRCGQAHAFSTVQTSSRCYGECLKIVDCPKKPMELPHKMTLKCWRESDLDGIVFENFYPVDREPIQC
jgi:hypothetical protein